MRGESYGAPQNESVEVVKAEKGHEHAPTNPDACVRES